MPGKMELPAYIQMRYEERGVFSQLKNDVANVTGVVRRDFEDMSSTIEKSLGRAISAPRTAGGSLDLGVGQMREAARAQEALARVAEETAQAARRAADATGGQARELVQAAQAAEALADKERAAAAAAQVRVDTMEAVQRELEREASKIDTVVAATKRQAAANDNLSRSTGAQRMASMMLGQQMQDATIQLQMGTSALTVLTQQGSQTAFALSGLGGTVGTVARFFAGPWGAAVFAGTAVLGPLIAELFHTEDALDAVKFSSNAVTDAQGILGNVMDIATGKISTQSQALIGLARAQLAVARVQSMTKASEARATIQDQASPSWYEYLSFTDRRSPEEFRRDRRTQLGVGDALSGNTNQAIKVLEGQLKAGKISQNKFTELAQAYANLGVETANAKVYDRAEALLDGTGGRDLLKPARPTKKTRATGDGGKAAREADALRKAGDAAAESIARINAKFDEAPRLIDTAAAATRELDAIIKDLSGKDPIKFADTIKDAQAAKTAVQDALVRPVDEARQASEQRLQVQQLLAQGRDDEVAGLQAIWALEQKLGDEDALRAKVAALIAQGRTSEAEALQRVLDQYPSMKRQVAEIAEIEARRTRELDRQRALFDAQLEVMAQAKRSLTDLFSGRKTDVLGDLKQSFKDLQGARLFDDLLGDAFAQLEDQLRRRTPLGKANDRLIDGVSAAAAATDRFATAVETAANRIAAATATDPSAIDGNEITVSRTRSKDPVPVKGTVDFSRLSGFALADAMATATTRPLLEELDRILGTKFMQNLSGTVSGIAAGKLVAGNVGMALGGARGLVHDFGPDVFGNGRTEALLGKFDTALGGAQTGTQWAGMMKSLGIKTSSTAAQIGGTLGAMSGIPGADVIASITWGLIGGALKKTKWARVILNSGGSTLQSNSGKFEDVVTEAGSSFGKSLRDIADQFGGSVGDFGNIALGVRHGDWRVNTGSGSLKVAKGATEFDKDAEAAMKYAIMAAIERGAIDGIRESTNSLLQAGDDLDEALQDALTWENAFRTLKSYRDPLGSALDDLDKEFERLIDLATTAGASTEEWADLQELYGIRQTEVIAEAKDRILGSLQDLFDDLTTGDSGLSLRSRRTAMLGQYDSLATRVASGDRTAYDDYAAKAQELLAIEREMYGSQSAYFDRLNEITDLTRNRIADETNVISIAQNRDNPFDGTGAVKSSIDTQTEVLSSQLDALNINVGGTNAALARIEETLAAGNWAGARVAFNGNY